jgi:transcriptional regulator with XRE-family HTH domain
MLNQLFESLSIRFFESLMDENFNIHLGKKLRMRRLSLGLTQTKVANAINVTFQQIQKYEKGTNGVSSSRLMQLSQFLKVPITYFYEDYVDSRSQSRIGLGSAEDLNYSFLIKTFGQMSESQKLKIIQILKNTGSLKETG